MLKKGQFILVAGLILLLLQSSLTLAQTENKKSGSGGGYFMMGLKMLDLDEFNSKLAAHGYPAFSSNFISIGGGGRGIVNKLVLGGEGQMLVVGEETATVGTESYKSQLTGGYGLFNIGCLIFSKNGLNIYPMLGLGGGGMTFTISENSAPTFDEILDNPKRSVQLNYGAFLLSVSVGLDYLLKLEENEKGFGGLLFGIQAGYLLAAYSDDWMTDSNEVVGGPDIGFNGPYVRFMIGGGGGSKEC